MRQGMARPPRGGRRAALVALGLALAGAPSTAWAADPGADTGLISQRNKLQHVCPAFTAAAGHAVPKRRGETVRGQKQNGLPLPSPPLAVPPTRVAINPGGAEREERGPSTAADLRPPTRRELLRPDPDPGRRDGHDLAVVPDDLHRSGPATGQRDGVRRRGACRARRRGVGGRLG